MALQLDKNLKSRLSKILVESIPQMLVQHGWFIDRASVAKLSDGDSAIPSQGSLRERLEQYVGEFCFSEFVYSYLTAFLRANVKYQMEDETKALSTIAPFLLTEDFSKELVETFDRLPWSYTFSFLLPSDLSALLPEDKAELVLSKSVRIIRLDGQLGDAYPMSTGNKDIDDSIHQLGLLRFGEPEWEKGRLYLQIISNGYLNVYGTTQPAVQAISKLKAFFGLCFSLRILERRYVYTPFQSDEKCFVHRLTKDRGWVLDNKLSLDKNLSSMISQISVGELPGSDNDPKLKYKFFYLWLKYFSVIFDSADTVGERIATACQWLFESYYGDNELLNFVQATVVLEILLGDKAASDEIGLGELLRSRCAYLIGTSRSQRDEILRDFKEIYKVRSQIVHRGKRHLRENERRLFWQLVWMGHRVIQEETKLLSEDVD